jgi:hypothetical protein
MPNFAFRYHAVRSSEKIDANAVGMSSGSEPAMAAILMKSRLLWKMAWFGGQLSELDTVLHGTVAFVVFRADGMVQKIFLQIVRLQALKLRLTTQKRSYSITPRLSEHSFAVGRQFKTYFRSYL